MTDSDKIYSAINELRQEVRAEFTERRKHVDREFGRVHERINDLTDKVAPLEMFTSNREFFWKTIAGLVSVLAILGGLVFAALRWFAV